MATSLALLWVLLIAATCGALAFAPHQLVPLRSLGSRSIVSHITSHVNKDPLVARFADATNVGADEELFSQPPAEIFAQIADGRSTIVFEDLKKWDELQELVVDGEVLVSELQAFYDKTSGSNVLDEAGFAAFYKMVDDLFEDNDEVEDESNDTLSDIPASKEEELISFLTTGLAETIDDLPCGMDCMDAERNEISDLVDDLVASDNNGISTIQAKNLLGTWELLYTSSKAMIHNGSLSGLTVSEEGIQFSALRQILTGSKFLGFVEFVETYTRGEEESFDIKIAGEWMLQEDTRTFESCTLQIDPEKIEYDAMMASGMVEAAPVVQMGGGISQVADWQSLGPIKLLDVVYASPELYIGRGQFIENVLFVWRKVKQ